MKFRKFPIFMILNGRKAYDFSRGNLTIDYIENHIIGEDYVKQAAAKTAKKDQEGLTLRNYNQFAVYSIKSLYGMRNGTFHENLNEALTDHFGRLQDGLTLIAKTYGIRRIIPNDDWILTATIFIACSPMLLLFAVMYWEHK